MRFKGLLLQASALACFRSCALELMARLVVHQYLTTMAEQLAPFIPVVHHKHFVGNG